MKLNGNVLAFCLLNAAVSGTAAFQASHVHDRPTTALNSFAFDPSGASRGVAGTGPSAEVPGDASPAAITRGAMKGNIGGNTPGSRGSQTSRSKRDLMDGVTVQGGSLKTWSFTTPYIERVQVNLKTEGRPLNADIDLWHGPDNTPQKIAVYIEDGKSRPFNAVIETPRGQNAVAIRNTASLEYPLKASVETDRDAVVTERPVDPSNSQIIQGGAIKTYTFAASVGSIAVLMRTDGRPLNARIELLQGPNNNKQVIDLYTEDGSLRPFYSIIQTPGSGNVVRIVNTATMEYPLTCSVEPYEVETFDYEQGPLTVDGFPFSR